MISQCMKYSFEIRPAYVIEENKVLYVIDALVISTFHKQICYQIRPGMNKPTLKSLCHWPNAKFEYIVN